MRNDNDYRNHDYRGTDYRDTDYRDTDYRETAFRDTDYRDTDYRETDYRDTDYRETDSLEKERGRTNERKREYNGKGVKAELGAFCLRWWRKYLKFYRRNRIRGIGTVGL